MGIGLQAADGPKIHKLCGDDRRLFMRIGNLLQAGLSVSEAVLAEAGRQDWLHKLLMHRGLHDVAPEDFAGFATGINAAAAELVLFTENDGNRSRRVLAWNDEVGNPLLADLAEDAEDRNLEGLRAVLPESTIDCRMTIERLLEADDDQERGAALEKLRYHLPPPAVLMELVPLVLTDGSPAVRERAHNLLAASGARPSVIELIRCLQEDDDIGLRNLVEPLTKLPEDQARLMLNAIVAHLGRGVINQTVVDLCTAHAEGLLAMTRWQHCIELFYAHAQSVSLVPLVRRLQDVDRERIDGFLHGLLGQSDEGDARLLAALLREGDACAPDLAERALSLLLAPRHVPRHRMGLAAALARIANPEDVLARLVERRAEIPTCPDPAALWLIGAYCRDGLVDRATADRLFESIEAICREGVGQQITAVLEQQLLRLLPADPDRLRTAVEPLGDLAARTRDARNLSVLEHNLRGLPRAAAPELWLLLEEHPHGNAKAVATASLDAVLADADADELRDAVERALDDLPEKPDPQRRYAKLLALAGRLAVLPGLDADPEPARLVDRRAEMAGIHAVECWGPLVASRHLPIERRSELVDILLRLLTHRVEEADPQEIPDESDDVPLYVLDQALSRHTEWVPEILAALHAIASSPHLPGPLLRHIVESLADQFATVAGWKAVWAPGNVMDLAAALADIALVDACSPALRGRIIKSMQPHLASPAIAAHVARIASRADRPHLAGQACTTFVDNLVNERMSDEDQGLVADAAVAFLRVPSLGEQDRRLRRQLASALRRLQHHLSNRGREALRDMLPALDEELRARLEWLGEGRA